jgi:hypothetical protein
MLFVRDDPILHSRIFKKAYGLKKFGSLEHSRKDRSVSDGITQPPLQPGVWEINIIPVLQGEIGGLKDQPDEDRPGDHQEEFFGSTEQKRISLETIDDRIKGEDIGPPRKAIEPTIKRVNFFKEKDFGDEEEEYSKNPMNGKGLFHWKLIYHIYTPSDNSKSYPPR